MYQLSLTILEITSIMGLFIIIFIYSAISSDTTTVLISLLLFLLFLLPFYVLINQLKFLMAELNLENIVFFKTLVLYSTIVNIFIGTYLFIELIYVFFFN